MMETSTGARGRIVGWGLLVMAIAAVMLAEPLLSSRPLYLRDLGMWHYPVLREARAADPVGVDPLPLWTSALGTGRPLLANPAYALLHPANALYLAFGFERAFNLYLILHVMVGGVGMLLLARRLALDGASAFVAAVAFMLGGHVMSCTAQYPMIAPVAWAPWVLTVGLAAAEKPRPGRVALLALVVALQLLGGQPEPALMTIAIGLVWTVAALGRPGRLRGVLTWAAATLWACALAAPQLLPAIRFARDTVRSLGLSSETVLYWSFHPARLIELISPPTGRWLEVGAPPNPLIDGGKPLFNSHYLGLSVVLLAIVGLIAGWWRRDDSRGRPPVTQTVLSATAGLGLILAFGRHLPGFEAVVGLTEGLVAFRYPVKFMFTAALAIPLLAAFGLKVIAGLAKPERRGVITLAVAFVVVFDLGLAHRRMAPVTEFARQEAAKPLLDALADASSDLGALPGQWRIYHHRLPQTGWGPRLADGDMVDADLFFAWQRRMLLPRTGLNDGLQHAFEPSVEILDTLEYFALTAAMHRSDLRILARSLGDAGVLWVASPKADLGQRSAGELDRVATLGGELGVPPGSGWLYRVVSYSPRLRLTNRFVVVPDAKAGDVVARYATADRRLVVMLEEDPGIAPSDDPAPAGMVEIVTDSHRGLILDVSCSRPCLLYVTDLLAPGWTVRVDGRPAKIIRANLAFRAVALGEGAHRVEFFYFPPGLSAGLMIAAVAGLGCFLCWWPAVRKRLRSITSSRP
jgi:hypothetical protein